MPADCAEYAGAYASNAKLKSARAAEHRAKKAAATAKRLALQDTIARQRKELAKLNAPHPTSQPNDDQRVEHVANLGALQVKAHATANSLLNADIHQPRLASHLANDGLEEWHRSVNKARHEVGHLQATLVPNPACQMRSYLANLME